MSHSDENIRHICGNTMFRRFAYVHKKDNQKFGLLEASDKANAREYLGRDFMIKETWLSLDEELDTFANRELKRVIVASLFPGLVGESENTEEAIDCRSLIKENKHLKQQLEDLLLSSRVEIVELKRKPKKPEKKAPVKVSADRIEIEKLRAHAQSYSNCLWSHCMSEKSFARDTNMLFNHAKFVGDNTEWCFSFLKRNGVNEVHWKHCQYFFSICWPIHKPWMNLTRSILKKLVEDGALKESDITGNPFADVRPLLQMNN